MTTNADARVAVEPSPCEGCRNRKVCADFSKPQACVAFEAYEDGQPMRAWRDAPRIPLESIGRRLLIRWHGKEAVEKAFPLKRKTPDELRQLLGRKPTA